MQFGSKLKRNILTNAILGLVPDVLISGVAASMTESGFMGFFAVLVGLQVLYLLAWARKTIWAWLFFWVRGRKQLADHALDYLRSNRYPEPDEYHADVGDYFGGIIDNERQAVGVRVRAANELGAVNALRNYGHVTQFLLVNLAYEDAIQRYKRSFPPGSIKDVQADGGDLFE
jgi:hypothetical protein